MASKISRRRGGIVRGRRGGAGPGSGGGGVRGRAAEECADGRRSTARPEWRRRRAQARRRGGAGAGCGCGARHGCSGSREGSGGFSREQDEVAYRRRRHLRPFAGQGPAVGASSAWRPSSPSWTPRGQLRHSRLHCTLLICHLPQSWVPLVVRQAILI